MNRVFHIGNSRQALLRVLSMLSPLLIKETDDLELEVRTRRKEKSHEQRKLWHALLTEFGKALGYSMPEMKDVVKREFYGLKVITLPDGKTREVIQSSEESDRENYSELIEFTYRLAAENGVLLQDRRAA